MAFNQLVPGMAPMPIPAMRPNQMMQQGMGALNMARGQPQGGQGLLQRLLNPAPAAPTDLAAPGMPPNAGAPGGGPMQMGMLAKLFPRLMAQPGAMQPQTPVMPQGDPTGGLGGLY